MAGPPLPELDWRDTIARDAIRRLAPSPAEPGVHFFALGKLTRSALWGDAFVQGAWLQDCTHKCFDPFYFEPLWWALHLVVVTHAERLGWPVVDPRSRRPRSATSAGTSTTV